MQNCHKQEKERKETRACDTWSDPLFYYQPKSFVLTTISSHAIHKQKRKRPKHPEPNFPPKTPLLKKSYWSMIARVIFDWIGNDLQSQVMTYLWFGIRMKHLSVWDLYTLSSFPLFSVGPSVSSKWLFRNEMLISQISFVVMRKFYQHAFLPQ